MQVRNLLEILLSLFLSSLGLFYFYFIFCILFTKKIKNIKIMWKLWLVLQFNSFKPFSTDMITHFFHDLTDKFKLNYLLSLVQPLFTESIQNEIATWLSSSEQKFKLVRILKKIYLDPILFLMKSNYLTFMGFFYQAFQI
jgi:hypothetical protein